MVKVKIKDLAPGAFFDIGPVKVKVMEHFADGKTLLTATEQIGNRPFTVRPSPTSARTRSRTRTTSGSAP